MSSVIDFLEKMGSEAGWRDAAPDQIELALTNAKIEGPMSAAILARDASALQILLGQGKKMSVLVPSPTPLDVPPKPLQPEPEEEEEETEEGGNSSQHQPSKSASDSASMSSLSSL
jgi:hypothetical protein